MRNELVISTSTALTVLLIYIIHQYLVNQAQALVISIQTLINKIMCTSLVVLLRPVQRLQNIN